MFQKEQWYVADCRRPSQTSISIKICRGRRDRDGRESRTKFYSPDHPDRSSPTVADAVSSVPRTDRRRSLQIIWEPGLTLETSPQGEKHTISSFVDQAIFSLLANAEKNKYSSKLVHRSLAINNLSKIICFAYCI